MKSHSLNKQFSQIISLIDNTRQSCGDNLELQGHWGKYTCVLASGFLENAISEVFNEFVSNGAAPAISSYTLKSLAKIQNPKTNKFIETATHFKKEWGESLEQFIDADISRKEAIDSIMTNRHLVAHGKNTNISIVKVKEYLEKSVEVIEFLESKCNTRVVK
ncbi:HEPN domain-containing protein [Pantoea ananatis]|uniref:HEPN domain-containing protein n=2 Tax=Pantoea ananas TaxID=553 RepID=UPI001B310D09|nr:HEPN domain-containing protein [Pantoea ananatis]